MVVVENMLKQAEWTVCFGKDCVYMVRPGKIRGHYDSQMYTGVVILRNEVVHTKKVNSMWSIC